MSDKETAREIVWDWLKGREEYSLDLHDDLNDSLAPRIEQALLAARKEGFEDGVEKAAKRVEDNPMQYHVHGSPQSDAKAVRLELLELAVAAAPELTARGIRSLTFEKDGRK